MWAHESTGCARGEDERGAEVEPRDIGEVIDQIRDVDDRPEPVCDKGQGGIDQQPLPAIPAPTQMKYEPCDSQ